MGFVVVADASLVRSRACELGSFDFGSICGSYLAVAAVLAVGGKPKVEPAIVAPVAVGVIDLFVGWIKAGDPTPNHSVLEENLSLDPNGFVAVLL
jgi:hypothetical protein